MRILYIYKIRSMWSRRKTGSSGGDKEEKNEEKTAKEGGERREWRRRNIENTQNQKF